MARKRKCETSTPEQSDLKRVKQINNTNSTRRSTRLSCMSDLKENGIKQANGINQSNVEIDSNVNKKQVSRSKKVTKKDDSQNDDNQSEEMDIQLTPKISKKRARDSKKTSISVNKNEETTKKSTQKSTQKSIDLKGLTSKKNTKEDLNQSNGVLNKPRRSSRKPIYRSGFKDLMSSSEDEDNEKPVKRGKKLMKKADSDEDQFELDNTEENIKKRSYFKPVKTASSYELSQYESPCPENSQYDIIQIQGNSSNEMLAAYIRNFKLPNDIEQTIAQAYEKRKRSNEIKTEEVNLNESKENTVKKVFAQPHIAKHYDYEPVKSEENEESINQEELMKMLTKCETEKFERNSSFSADNDSDNTDSEEDFEEVENAIVDGDIDSYRPDCLSEGVTIELQPSFKPKATVKNLTWIYDTIRLNINRQRREIYINATKVAFLCYLARVKYLNELTFDPQMQALALSTHFFENMHTKSITEPFVKEFINKFKNTFKFTYCQERSQLLTCRDAIIECFETKETRHPTVYNLILLILFRTFCKLNHLKEKSRLCLACRPIDFKCDIVISKKSMAQKKIALNEEDENTTETKNSIEILEQSEIDKMNIDKTLNKKNLIELWIEIYLDRKEWILTKTDGQQASKELVSKDEWYCVEPINGIYTSTPKDLEKKFYINPLYILSFNSERQLKDLTPKYIANFYLFKFKRLRLEDDWLDQVYKFYRSSELSPDEQEEDRKIRKYHFERPIPKTLTEYKNHGLYALKRDLLKFEIIFPEDSAPVVGKFNEKENIYLRLNVQLCHGIEQWKRVARQIKRGEDPIKVVTARPKWDKHSRDWIKGLPLELYHYSQTQEWKPDRVVNGKVPRNTFGNVEIFRPCMVPKNATHLRLNGLLKIAQRLEVDCAPAVVGFELRNNAILPKFDGFVVPSECAQILTMAWQEEQEIIEQREMDRYERRVFGNWRKLIRGVQIRMDIIRKYRNEEEDKSIF